MNHYCVMFHIIDWNHVPCSEPYAFDMHMVQASTLDDAVAKTHKAASSWGCAIKVLGALESGSPIKEAVWYDTVSIPLTIE